MQHNKIIRNLYIIFLFLPNKIISSFLDILFLNLYFKIKSGINAKDIPKPEFNPTIKG